MTLFPVDQSAEGWAKRYKLSLKPRRCSNCDQDLYPEIPFATREWRGLRSKPHACGPKFDLKRLTPASKRDRGLFLQLYRELTSVSSGG